MYLSIYDCHIKISEMNILKKFILIILALCTAFFACACTNTDKNFEIKKVSGELLKVGDSFSVNGIGDFTLDKICTTQRLQPSLHFGTYLEPVGRGMQYIDAVFRFKSKKADISADSVGTLIAVGDMSGVEYTDSISAVETDDNRNLSASEKITANTTVTLHMAVEVPIESAEKYKLKIRLRTATYEVDYTVPKLEESMERIYEGQSMSNTQLKVKLDKIGYSRKLYDNAPKTSDCAANEIYLVAEMTVSNKDFEDRDFQKLVSACVLYGNESYDMEYMMSGDGKKYAAKGEAKGLGETKLLAAVALPLEYSEKDAKVVLAIDFEEFMCEVEGTNEFTKKPEPQPTELKSQTTSGGVRSGTDTKSTESDDTKTDTAATGAETKSNKDEMPPQTGQKAPKKADDEAETVTD